MVPDRLALAGQVGVATGGGQRPAEASADVVVAGRGPGTGPQSAEEIRGLGRLALFVW